MQSTHTKLGAELVLLHLSDSALPTGSFSHSFGLETYILRDKVTDPETFANWLYGYIRQLGYSEGLITRMAAEVVDADLPLEEGVEELRRLDALSHASLIPRQVRDANQSMGKRMAKIARIAVQGSELLDRYLDLVISGECYGSPPLVYGVAVRVAGTPTELVVAAYLMQLATSITQNAIRGIPLGQDAGQRVLSGGHLVVEETAQRIKGLAMADLGACPPGLELAQISHETVHSRMFMS